VEPTVLCLPPRDFVKSGEALSRVWTAAEAEAYTAWLAASHYENFHVASVLLPRRLRQDFVNLYAFCRWADDLGDEIGDTAESLRLLAWWRDQLGRMYAGEVGHPVFLALRRTVERHGLPREPLEDLIRAFVQDQTVKRYRTWEEVFAYCRCSANPVGRLVLRLFGYSDPERQRLSDATCTALQLANFWQDVSQDLDRGRIYLPLELLAAHGCPESDVVGRRATPAFRAALSEAVAVARRLFHEGLPLGRTLDRRLGLEVERCSRGGVRILDKIERQQFDVFRRRPRVSRTERVWILAGAAARALLRHSA
jgi:squalene synthase HpnC